jgi:PAS domain S-box-containing protein
VHPSIETTQQQLDHQIGRFSFASIAVISALNALLLIAAPPLPLPDLTRVLSALACAALAVLGGWATWASLRRWRSSMALWVACATTLLLAGMAGVIGPTLTPIIAGYLAMLVAVSAILVPARYALALALVGAAAVLLPALPQQSWGACLAQALMVGSGLALGLLVARGRSIALTRSAEREARVARLLGMAVDWYWELSADLRLTQLSSAQGAQATGASQRLVGRGIWELLGESLDETELDAAMAWLETRQAVVSQSIHLRDAEGLNRHYSISGEPRYDHHGVFLGYWGVSRDITPQLHAQRAGLASEARYRELFSLSPSPLLLHRDGRVLDANQSAARLLDYPSPEAMRGVLVAELSPPGAMQEAARQRIALLERLPMGDSMPVAELQLQSCGGRLIHVQATGVRVPMGDGPASLSLYFDMTARVNTERALRRSESLLSQVFATSPDCIVISELATGRIKMVNQGFTDMFGFTAAEAVGLSSQALGLWSQRDDWNDLVSTTQRQGAVRHLPATMVAKSGRRMSASLSAAMFAVSGQHLLVMMARDVTAQERTRREHEAMLQSASIGIAFTQRRTFMQVNPQFERIFGWAEGALAGQPGHAVWASLREYGDMSLLIAERLAQGESVDMERQMKRHDGSVFWCRLMARAIDPLLPERSGTIWIAEDITERRDVALALAQARDDAEAASRAKSAFLANTSHELRTPLNGLLGLAHLAQQPDLDPVRRQTYLGQLSESAHNLSRIISDVLDLARVEAGKLTIEHCAFDLRQTLHNVQAQHQPLAEAQGLTLTLQVADDVPAHVNGDGLRVRQILSNYLTNALKFTEQGHVALQVQRLPDGERLRFDVSDSGPGIDSEVMGRLFMPFSQADVSTTRRHGGTGLGLSICRELAEAMGGEVGANSLPGVGSRFWVILPLPTASAPPAAPHSGASGDSDGGGLQGRSVLLVEDNAVNMLIGVALLERWGMHVTQATDGQRAIDAVAAADAAGQPFDAVLLDVQMPVMSGHDAARLLRQQHPTLPLIALTAAALTSEREKALAAGMNDFLTKPIDADRLYQTLLRHVTRQVRRPLPESPP